MKLGLALATIMSPWIFALGAYMYLAANCEDDFCAGFLWEIAVAIALLSALVAIVSWLLLRRGRGVARAGIAGWSTAAGVAAAFFAYTQYLESDMFPASMAIVLSLAAFGFAWATARSPRAGDPFAPRNAF